MGSVRRTLIPCLLFCIPLQTERRGRLTCAGHECHAAHYFCHGANAARTERKKSFWRDIVRHAVRHAVRHPAASVAGSQVLRASSRSPRFSAPFACSPCSGRGCRRVQPLAVWPH